MGTGKLTVFIVAAWVCSAHAAPIVGSVAYSSGDVPDPPDAATRVQQLATYGSHACAAPVEVVVNARFVFVTIAKSETPYIEEWVLYHLFIGVDLIYLYDNEREPTYSRMFACNPRVKVRNVRGARCGVTPCLFSVSVHCVVRRVADGCVSRTCRRHRAPLFDCD